LFVYLFVYSFTVEFHKAVSKEAEIPGFDS